MDASYAKVLADLEKVKADAEAGMRAIRRLMETGCEAPGAQPEPEPNGPSVPTRILEFLNANPSKSFRLAEISEATKVTKLHTLRGALGRLVKAGKIAKAGRGKFRARSSQRASSADMPS